MFSRPESRSTICRSTSLLIFIVAAVFVSACRTDAPRSESPTATEASQLAVAPEEALDASRFHAIERVFAYVWNRVPAFSGFWYDDQDALVIGVTDRSAAADVGAVLEEVAGGAYFYDANGARRAVRATEAAYDFKTMIDWKHQARIHLGTSGFHALDYAEDRNEIVAVVEDGGDRVGVADALRDLGIPDDRLTVETGPPMISTAEITEKYRPVLGGLEISRFKDNGDPTRCTLGFNAFLGTTGGFVTNSHCAPPIGQNDGIAFYQDSTVSADSIGLEHTDPPLFFGGACSHSGGCRWSDAVFLEYDGGVNWEHGDLANIDDTNSCVPDNWQNEKTISATDPLAEITTATRTGNGSWGDPPAVGEDVYHLGRTTGETWAEMVSTNRDRTHSGEDVQFLDQYESECQDCWSEGGESIPISWPGDSGGPVYRYHLYCGATVRLDGIRHATDPSGTTVIFSPIDNIDDDFASYGGLDIEN